MKIYLLQRKDEISLSVNAKKNILYDNQQPSLEQRKVQRLSREGVEKLINFSKRRKFRDKRGKK